ncbi:MAG: hypothetical protein ABIR59_04545 [Gemmatimonadales bacterium]
MRRGQTDSLSSVLTTDHPLATTVDHPVATPATASDNDKAWGLMYEAITDGIGADPNNFQVIYPFITWDWPIVQRQEVHVP